VDSREIIKIVAIRCLILRPKCTRFDFGAYSAYGVPQTHSWISGGLLREGREVPQFEKNDPIIRWLVTG